MAHSLFSLEWLHQFSDPYAVLGVSLTADERRVLKRYRHVAKLLHPDSHGTSEPEIKEAASQLFARLVSPSYQKLKQEKDRAETLATLRIRIKQINRDEPFQPKSEPARHLMKAPVHELDMFYEQAITQLADTQFDPLSQFEAVTQQLAELNLVYLSLKMREPVIREKRIGIISAKSVNPSRPVEFAPTTAETPEVSVNYAQRHYQRAQEYAKKSNWAQVVAELRDAIRLEPQQSEFHSLIAKAYLMQNLIGMAKVHFRQALKFNPQDPLALQYVAKLNLGADQPNSQPIQKKEPKSSPESAKGGLFGLFKKR